MISADGRAQVLTQIADRLVARRTTHPLRVAVDGITAAGKSTFAAELAALVAGRGRPALHLSTDDYHHQRAYRYRQGRDSAEGVSALHIDDGLAGVAPHGGAFRTRPGIIAS